MGNATQETLLEVRDGLIAPETPVTIKSNGVATTVANTKVQLSVTATDLAGGIAVQADPGNAANMRVGGTDIDATHGYILAPGGAMGWDRVRDARTLYLYSTVSGDKLIWGGTS